MPTISGRTLIVAVGIESVQSKDSLQLPMAEDNSYKLSNMITVELSGNRQHHEDKSKNKAKARPYEFLSDANKLHL